MRGGGRVEGAAPTMGLSETTTPALPWRFLHLHHTHSHRSPTRTGPCTLNAAGLLSSRRGVARAAPPCPTTLVCGEVYLTSPYLGGQPPAPAPGGRGRWERRRGRERRRERLRRRRRLRWVQQRRRRVERRHRRRRLRGGRSRGGGARWSPPRCAGPLGLPWAAAVDGPRGEPEAVPAAGAAAPPGSVRPPARRRVFRARRGGVASHRGARGGRKERRIASATFTYRLPRKWPLGRVLSCHTAVAVRTPQGC